MPFPKIHVLFAEHCAWRATYLYANERQIARIGIDPTASEPAVFGAFPYGWYTRECDGQTFPRVFEFRLRIPFMAWKFNQWYIRNRWQRFVRSLDGRYTAKARAARANCR